MAARNLSHLAVRARAPRARLGLDRAEIRTLRVHRTRRARLDVVVPGRRAVRTSRALGAIVLGYRRRRRSESPGGTRVARAATPGAKRARHAVVLRRRRRDVIAILPGRTRRAQRLRALAETSQAARGVSRSIRRGTFKALGALGARAHRATETKVPQLTIMLHVLRGIGAVPTR